MDERARQERSDPGELLEHRHRSEDVATEPAMLLGHRESAHPHRGELAEGFARPGVLAVPAAAQTPDALRRRFATPPLWTPEIVREKKFVQRPPAEAAVLVPIVQRERPTVLLTERTAHLSTHKGQVAFPGERSDPEDLDAAATALRETHEEVGLEAGSVEV